MKFVQRYLLEVIPGDFHFDVRANEGRNASGRILPG
jgi:hypothetical protein